MWEALSLMTVKGIRHLPVCDEGRPLGIVSIDDLAYTPGAHRLLEGMDEATRARVADILLWCAEQVGLRREQFPVLAGLD
jgi:signal-transduction protein with cAMP-binding, CBS, and nucleotidyltransferase domain